MATQLNLTGPALIVGLPALSGSQKLLGKRRLQVSQYGQQYSISFARRILSSATLRARLNVTCSAAQQTQRHSSSTITATPTKDSKTPKLDDGGTGFPPWFGGGWGGGGGGGSSSSGGFFLFAFLVLLNELKEMEGDGDGWGFRDQQGGGDGGGNGDGDGGGDGDGDGDEFKDLEGDESYYV